MEFTGYVRALTDTNIPLSIDSVWDFKEFELSPVAHKSSELFQDQSGPFFPTASKIAALSQALLEFQDLITMMLPQKGRIGSVNFLFYEGISGVREAILIGISGLTHSSFAALRAAVEMLVLHEWWRERLFFADSHEDFYGWLEGKRKAVPFRNALESNFDRFAKSPELVSISDAYEIYEFLCRYAHRPILSQSIIPLRGGNIGTTPTKQLMSFWLVSIQRVLTFILHHMISARPECLIEVDVYRKFGFNKPIGMFFDRYNLIALEMALGKEQLERLRNQFKENNTVMSLVEFAGSYPDLIDEEILASWKEPAPGRDGSTLAEKIFLRILHQKAHTRALSWAFASNLGVKGAL